MTAKRNIPEEWKNQWSKFMFNFFDYLPTKYEANKREWAIRKMIWDFKDGKRSVSVAEMVAKKIREQFGADCENVTFVCIPASSAHKNEIRYKVFSGEVARRQAARTHTRRLLSRADVWRFMKRKVARRCRTLKLSTLTNTFSRVKRYFFLMIYSRKGIATHVFPVLWKR